jgi:hypothetical protein
MEKRSLNENRENKRMLIERRIFEYSYHVHKRRKRTNRKNEYSFISRDHYEPAKLKKT